MVAGRRRDHAAGALIVVEAQQRVARSTLLEAAGALEIVQLAEHAAARDLGQRHRLGAGRFHNPAANPAAGLVNIDGGDRHGEPF